MEWIAEYLPFLIPIAVIQVGLTVITLIHVFSHKSYKHGSRVLWAILSFVNIIGPVLYFTIGKGDE